MLPGDHKLRIIVEEDRFRDELAALRPNPVRADEFVDGVKNFVCKDPADGKKIGDNMWFLPMRISNLAVYYRFNEDYVYLLSIRAVETQLETDEVEA